MNLGKSIAVSVLVVCLSIVFCVERCSKHIYSPEAIQRDKMNALASCIEKVSSSTNKNNKKIDLEEAKKICESL